MTTTLEKQAARTEEMTRYYRSLAQPIRKETPPQEPTPPPKAEPYLLAPRPWPRGQFIIHPED